MWDSVFEKPVGTIEESVTIHYNKFTERGLQVVANFFKRKGFEVVEIIPDDKLTKKDGTPTKKATFVFVGGQVLELLIAFKLDKDKQKLKGAKLAEALTKSLGTVFQAKVNKKKVPIQMARTSGPVTMKSLTKIVDFLGKSKATKADRKKMVSATQAAEKKAAPKKPTSAAAKLNLAASRRDELQASLDAAKKELEEENTAKLALDVEIGDLTSELNGLLEGNEALEQQLLEKETA